MAAKVNTKFVVFLASALFLLFVGVAGLALFAHSRSGERLVKAGDELAAAGQHREAARKYSRAVNKDQTNIEWIKKWRESLLQVTPANQVDYLKAYNEQYIGMIMYQLAAVQSTDPEPQIEYIEALDKRVRRAPGGGSAAAFQQIATRVTELARRLDESDPRTRVLLGYRGRANVDAMSRLDTATDDEREQALKDVEAALEADPDDTRNALAILQWYEAEIQRLRGRSRNALAGTKRVEARERLAAFLERHPDDPELRLFAFGASYSDEVREVSTIQERLALVERVRPRAEELLESMSSLEAERLTPTVVRQTLVRLTPFLDSEESDAMLLSFLEKSLETRPDSAELLLLKGRFHTTRGDYELANQTFQRVIDLPSRPVSLEGMLLPQFRQAAAAEQVDALLAKHETTDDEAEKKAVLASVRERREALAALVSVGFESELKLRDAKIAIVEGRLKEAAALLAELKSEAPENPTVLNLLGKALADLGHLGEARNVYESIISLGSGNFLTHIRLGDIELSLQNTNEALEHFERALELNPEATYAQRRITSIRTFQGDLDAGQTLDPVVKALIDFREARNEGATTRAKQIIIDARDKNPDDMRLIREHVALVIGNDREEALAIVDDALSRRPESRELRGLREFVSHEDPLEAARAVIAQSDASELEKAISLYNVYMQRAMAEEAAEAFAEAESIDPNDPTVIEIGFLRSVTGYNSRDPEVTQADRDASLAAAKRYAERAAEQNVDNRGGLTFKGRLEMARQSTREAEITFRRCTELMEFDPEAWRWLAQAQRANGKLDQAIESYARAYASDPQSATIAGEYALALAAANQGQRALEVVGPETGALQYNSTSAPLNDLWLRLEAQYGDRAEAIERRFERFERDPSNATNTRNLLGALIEAEDWERSGRVIERLRTVEDVDPFLIAQLEMRLLAEQGKANEAREAYLEYVETVPADDRSRLLGCYIGLGAFEKEFGSDVAALEAYEKALPYQGEAMREADRAIGDLLFAMGEDTSRKASAAGAEQAQQLEAQSREYYFRANEHYKAIADASPTVDQTVAKRRAETLIRLSQYEDALALLGTVGTPEELETDLQVLLLKSIIAAGNGDERAARRYLDTAVETYPANPTPFFRRAALNASNAALDADTLDDLDKVVELNPGMIEAWTLRFSVYQRQQKMDEAFTQLRRAIDKNPQNEDLKTLLLTRLDAAGRKSEAQAFAVQVADQLDTNRAWLRTAALMSYDSQSYNEAERLFRKIYSLEPDPESASDLLNVILRKPVKPTRREVNQLLTKVKESDRKSPGMQMLQARAHEFLEEPGPAQTLTIEAYELALDQENAQSRSLFSRLWFDNLVLRFDGDMERAFEYIRTTDALGTLPAILRVMLVRQDTLAGASPSECLAHLEEIEAEVGDDIFTMLELLKLRNQLHYALGQYEKCVEVCKRGLALHPRVRGDLELNNNLAYTLAKHLGDPEAAEPYAEAAAAAAPLNPAVLDTLGWVKLEKGAIREANRILTRALDTATTDDEKVPAYLHLAMCKVEVEDMAEARRLIGLAKEAVGRATRIIKEQYGAEIDALYAELN